MSITLTDLLNEDPAQTWCPTCLGDGFLTYVGGPGYYSLSYGNYLPTESQEPCDDCHGSGRADDGNSPLNAVRQHLRRLTPSLRLHLKLLTKGQRLPITPANYQALEELFGEIDNELGYKHPVTAELDRALENAQPLDPSPAPASHDKRARIH
jgi:hypothetical protein